MPLFGRAAAVAAVREALTQARAGRGELVLVAGEPGIGKTAVARAALAGERGLRCVWAACRADAGTPAYWPWVQVLRELGQELPAAVAGGHGRFDLFDGIARAVRRAAADGTVLLVFDDLHWSDEPSLRALRFVVDQVRTAPVLLLGTYRDAEAGGALLDLARGARVVQLAGLPEHDVAMLMADVAGTAPDPGLVRDVWRRTAGNPFFVREVTRLLTGGAGLRASSGQEVPDGVREVLDRRLSRLPAGCGAVLADAAVIGTAFDAGVVARAGGRPIAEVVAALDTAARARVVTGAEAGHRFVHELFRDTVYTGMAPAERTARHAAVATVLRDDHAAGRPVPAAELAVHFARAGPEYAAPAVRWSVRAAEAAIERLAFEDACLHYERALASSGAGTSPEPRVLLLNLGTARHRCGRAGAARAAFVDAAAAARDAGDPDVLADAALGLHRLGARAGTADPAVTALLDEAVAAFAGRPGPALARLLAAKARTVHHMLRADEGPAGHAERAVALARAEGDDELLADCLLALHDAHWRPGSAAVRRPIVAEMAAAADRAGDRERAAQALQLRAAVLIELGDPAGVAALADYCRLAGDLGHAVGRWNALTRRATLALVTGRPDEAAELSAAAAALGERIGEPDVAGVAGTQAWALARLGHRPVVHDLPDTLYGHADHQLFRVIRLMAAGDQAGAARAAAGFTLGLVPASHDPEPLVFAAGIFAAFGPDEQRRAAYEALLPLAGTHAVVGGCAAYHGAIDHYLGDLAAALGRPAEARAHHQSAREMYRRLGAVAWADVLRRSVAPRAVFRRDGDVWTVGFEGTAVHLADGKGLHDLATLLAAPGREIHVRELLGLPGPMTGADPVLDARAVAEYRARLSELDDDVRAADPERAARARAERDFLRAELASVTGLGGRARLLGDEADRARKTVTARIRYAMARIDRAHPVLAAHLAASVHTGISCVYAPADPVSWDL